MYDKNRPIEVLLEDIRSKGAVMLYSIGPVTETSPIWVVDVMIKRNFLPPSTRAAITDPALTMTVEHQDLEEAVKLAYSAFYFATEKGTGAILTPRETEA